MLHNITGRQHLDVRCFQIFYEFLNPRAQIVHAASLAHVTFEIIPLSDLGATVAQESVSRGRGGFISK